MGTDVNKTLPIQTESLVLRPFVPGDTATIYSLSLEPEYQEWLPSQLYADEAEAGEALDYLIAQSRAPGDPRLGPYVLALEHRADGVLIGHVGLSPYEDDVEIGFAVAASYHRRGLATEAVIAMCRWASAEFSLPRVLAIAAQSNHASRRVLERAGFQHQEDRAMTFQGADQAVSMYAWQGPEPLGQET